jgi:precorrin isomerase
MMGDLTDEAKEIVRRSYEIVEKYVKGNSPEDFIIKRCIISTGDPEIKNLIVFRGDAVKDGIKAIRRRKRVITDVAMVKAGIRAMDLEVLTAIEHGDGASGRTRVSAGMLNLGAKIDGSIVAIGNAPSAAITLCDMVEMGIKPSLVVATPVGFVNAAESKEMIRGLDIPSITTVGTRGGSTLCVAIINSIIALAL